MLTQRSKYALRALQALAAQEPEQRLLSSVIAKEQRIPQKFLEQILLDLCRCGMVASHRGRNGGYRLARKASAITIGEVIRTTDGPLAPIACASLTGYEKCKDCIDEKRCSIRKLMRRVRDSMSEILDHTTLADTLAK
ncbi:MAG: Rrf2 family transcriptional regulator [Rhodospirillaceae bacterium]|nr:Rrf2 family transcriptional regulator [Rhodospirillaceae bacterium]